MATTLRVLFLLFACRCASGANLYNIDFEPAWPIEGEEVVAHVAVSGGVFCSQDPGSVERSASTIVLKIVLQDFCSPDDTSTRNFALGGLEAGHYDIDFQGCGYNPPPLPSGCATLAHAQLTVAKAGPLTVPALPLSGGFVMAVALIAIVARRLITSASESFPPSSR